MSDEGITPQMVIVCSKCRMANGVIKLKDDGIVCPRCWMKRHDALKNPEEDEEL